MYKEEKLAIVTPMLSGKGGIETVLSIVLKDSDTISNFEKIDLIILGNNNSDEWLKKLPSNIHIHFTTDLSIFRILILLYQLLLNNYSKVICMSTNIIKFVNFIRNIFKMKFTIVSWIHFSLFNEETINPKILKLADYNLAISSGIMKQMLSMGIDEKKINLIFNPVEKKEKVIPVSMGLKHEFAYIGRILLNNQKNLRELFDGISLLKKNSIVLHMYGDGQVNECKKYIIDNNIEQTIIWHGWVNNPWEDIKAMDAILLTSKYEGFPMALLESISYGIPVISSNCPTGPDDIVTKDNGILYKMGNIQELAKDILSIKEMDFDHLSVRKTSEKYYTTSFSKKFWNSINNS